ncbi:MAG: anthranilate phosphoribosyltransferase [Sulfurimonas sp. RIFOXYD12_FULL_33_39]|uniref:anthranilate phosphoribosyltransferase n=1 Tax=unclassified Sulfurimonas TaxID=2623549 RepID=UPI0008C291BC|nr:MULTISPECIES: anthranilate phosphoribosyltransferase [unclassified Sulfurimonas]OHE09313.1 MAG: anthranilate phosphoribosyltransferase [Sulfurimonas sp. RIFOXYD12_FULL_33_39]OHE12904.1 MAG: anthranilate phosphoribosyltransferase [Sulfurimonas sp. RIFOXYD2_FULL_34_21]DAB27316.1 MAG TPA: anthranilate phosphoribosyltransferase [Sulfurimonas sp. UBA10385]
MSYEEAKKLFTSLFNHEMSDEQMREFLLSLKLDESTKIEVIAAAAEVMRSFAIPLPISDDLRHRVVDIVGTGGDKIGSFNISSTVAILVASCGSMVAKHGSRSVTSKSGSADMFEELGVRLDLSIQNSAKLLEETGFTFMFAANHHPAMKFIMPVRKTIPDKTIFNILGPLTNPAGAKKSLLGVFNKSFVPKMAKALQINGATSAMVVSSSEGMDEISLSDITYASQLKGGVVNGFIIDPQMYGIKKAPLSAIIGGDAKANAKILYNIFDEKSTDAQRDIVLINTACALMVDGLARDIQDGLEMAREAIKIRKAKEKLENIIEISNKL